MKLVMACFQSFAQQIKRDIYYCLSFSSENSEKLPNKCIDLHAHVERFNGRFSSGKPNGPGFVDLSYDGSTLEGNFVQGTLHGRVRHTRKKMQHDQLLLVASYREGRADGPGWIFPPDYTKSGYIYAVFKEGELDEKYPVIHFSSDLKIIYAGKLNGTWLQEAVKVNIEGMADYDCIKTLRVSEMSENAAKFEVKLPVLIKTVSEIGLILVRSSKTLVFNRVAKTGSQSLIELLVQLKKHTGLEMNIDRRPVEHLMEPAKMVNNFVQKVDSSAEPTAFVRHYNFVNFLDYGSIWNPVYINIVRDPLERVITSLYSFLQCGMFLNADLEPILVSLVTNVHFKMTIQK